MNKACSLANLTAMVCVCLVLKFDAVGVLLYYLPTHNLPTGRQALNSGVMLLGRHAAAEKLWNLILIIILPLKAIIVTFRKNRGE